jgi:hypothetical protein
VQYLRPPVYRRCYAKGKYRKLPQLSLVKLLEMVPGVETIKGRRLFSSPELAPAVFALSRLDTEPQQPVVETHAKKSKYGSGVMADRYRC